MQNAKMELLDRAVRECGDLPVAPQVITRLEAVCKDPRASAKMLSDVLAVDTGLMSKILRQVNSSFYGFPQSIKTLKQAVVILGFQEIKNIAMSVPVAGFFQGHIGKPGIDIGTLWEHTIETACMARALAKHIEHELPEQVFLMAILRNIGMVALNNVLGEEYLILIKKHGGKTDFPEWEQKEIGVSHSQVGMHLASRWHFPDELIDFIRDHHFHMRDSTILREPALVRVSRRIMQGMAREEAVSVILAEIPEEVVVAFSLDPEGVIALADKAKRDVQATRTMLGSD